jgi:pilus assembly protein Flp/PilA
LLLTALVNSLGQGRKEKGMALFNQVLAAITKRTDNAEGQGLAEYALILALIAIVAIVALLFLGTAISSILNQVGTAV